MVIPVHHDQAKAGQSILECVVDIQLYEPSGYNYYIGTDEFRLLLTRDGTVIAPAQGPNDVLGPMSVLRGVIVSFSIPDPIAGTYTLQLRDPGGSGNVTPTPDKVWSIPVVVPPWPATN